MKQYPSTYVKVQEMKRLLEILNSKRQDKLSQPKKGK